MKYVLDFTKLRKEDVVLAGGKGASLGEMTSAGLPVPPGFVILSTAFERFLKETDLNVEIDSALDSVNHKEIHTVEKASEKIEALILVAEIPKDIADEIKRFFEKLGAKYVAVRSSATAEDSASAAWAGQLESYLNTTEEKLFENVKKCWASLFTPRAIFYRFEKNLHKHKISVAVVVQKMVESEKSGIAFSVHPVTQDRNQLIIEAGFGLGEAIVSGQITPDSYVIEKQPLRIVDKNVQTQVKGFYRAENGENEWRDIPKEQGEKQILSDKEILEITKIILHIENHYGFPCDIEWAFESEKFYITQSRPITTLADLGVNDIGAQQNYSEKDVDWVLYLERQQPIFLFASFVRPYGLKLKEATGFGFVHQLHHFKNDTGFFYRSSVEMKNADEYYLTLIKSNDKRLRHWQELGIRYNSTADDLIKRFAGGQFRLENIVEEYNKIQEQCEEIMMYGTVIPYRILSAVNSAIEAGESNKIFQEVLALYEPLRATTKYPALVEHVFPLFWKAAVDITGTKNQDIFSLLDPDELGDVFHKPVNFDHKKVEQRKLGCVFWFDQESKHFVFSTDQDFLEKNGIQINALQDVSQLKGSIANKGVARGHARIINNLKDAQEFSDGDIVVSINTSPSLMPILVKCSGIVTDEGGIMCHAAIVSRELDKPCIIGTKVATKVIKNGDVIEVDANRGIVTILEK